MDLGLAQPGRLSASGHGQRLEVSRDHGEDLLILSPATEPAERLEPAIDRGRPQALDGHQVLSVAQQVGLGEVRQHDGCALDLLDPLEEKGEVATIRADRQGGQTGFDQRLVESPDPILVDDLWGWRYSPQCDPPRSDAVDCGEYVVRSRDMAENVYSPPSFSAMKGPGQPLRPEILR